MRANDGTKGATSQASAVHQDSPQQYEIRVKGHLDARWSAWFDGLSLTTESDGTTTIHGPVVDQAALHGLLQRLRDVGMPLVSVTQVDPTALMHPSSILDELEHEGNRHEH
jgi:hypothetical protein